MQEFFLIGVIAITVEALVEYGKSVRDVVLNKDYKTALTQLAAILVAEVICFPAGADLYAVLGVSFAAPWLGTLLTGILLSRGSNYVHSIVQRFRQASTDDWGWVDEPTASLEVKE